MTTFIVILFFLSCSYQVLATGLSVSFCHRTAKKIDKHYKFSQVKPLRSVEPEKMRNLTSFIEMTRGPVHDFYICSAESGPEDWLSQHPDVTWLKLKAEQSGNGKAATLALGEKSWSGEIFVVSDADMTCSPEYLDTVLGEFEDPQVGVVTCLYRGDRTRCQGVGCLLESLFILDFSASVLVAERTEGLSFAMGSTMAVRKEALAAIGGFKALEPYLADDYQLGHKAKRAGWKVRLAPTVLSTDLGSPSVYQALEHQFRWMVTSRISRPSGHGAFLLTQGLIWALVLAVLSPSIGLSCLSTWCCLRILMGALQNWALRAEDTFLLDPAVGLLPLKDFVYLVMWFFALFVSEVNWGGQRLRIDSDGRILRSPSDE